MKFAQEELKGEKKKMKMMMMKMMMKMSQRDRMDQEKNGTCQREGDRLKRHQ